MATTPADQFPVEGVSDALATVGDGGTITAQNERMRRLLVAAVDDGGTAQSWRELGFDAAAQARLQAGDVVAHRVAGVDYEWRRVRCGATVWLLATPRTAAPDRGADHHAVRVRALGRFAGSIVHDLANLLGAGLGLAETLRPRITDPLELQLVDELARGTRHAAALGRALARLLRTGPRSRTEQPLQQLVEEVLAVVGKYGSQRGISVHLAAAPGSPFVRVVAEEACQALLQGLMYCIEGSTGAIEVEIDELASVPGAGRLRETARVRLISRGMGAEAARIARLVVNGQSGGLAAASGRGDVAVDLVQATLAVTTSGGRLLVGDDDPFTLEFWWPRVLRPGPAGAP